MKTEDILANSIGTRADDPAPPVPDKLRVSVGITNAASSLRNYAGTLDYVESKLNEGIITPEEAVATVRALWDELQAIVTTTTPFSER